MSLATTGGGGGMAGAGGAGAMAMASHANAMAHPPVQPPGGGGEAFASAPPAAYASGATIEKNQLLSTRQVDNVSHLPIVAVDLHATTACQVAIMAATQDISDSHAGCLPISVGTVSPNVVLRANETSQKTLRKYLSKSRAFVSLQKDCLVAGSKDHKETVVLEKPACWLGLRKLEQAPEFVRSKVTMDNDSSPAIAEEVSQDLGVTMTVSTLDGSAPTGDDFDRVVAKVRLHSAKKALTILPEESVEMILRQAQYLIKSRVENEDEIEVCPLAIALPAWSFHDAAVEALAEATGAGSVFYLRAVAALTGALVNDMDKNLPLLKRLVTVTQTLAKAHEAESRQKELKGEANDTAFTGELMIIMHGMTAEGYECVAVQVNKFNESNISCMFGAIKVVSIVSYQGGDPLKLMEKCSKELEANIDAILPEADGPSAIVFYGSTKEQDQMNAKWNKVKSSQKEWTAVPTFTSQANAVAMGTAVLAGCSHGRLTIPSSSKGNDGRTRKANVMAIQIGMVAPVSVGVQISYHGGKAGTWTPFKTIFDFDRALPAGPYEFDFKAAECVAYREKGWELTDEDMLLEAKKNEGSKGIPKREEAALNLQVQFFQKWTRDGEWLKVGNVIEPLVVIKDLDEESSKRNACEETLLTVSLSVTGVLSTSLEGERLSVVQALETARRSALQYYGGILAAVSFFGYFLFRSYWESHVLERDARRLLAYYKHVLPGSISDGDENHARYVAYKYRNKKAKLWAGLEKKYGEPVLFEHEWPEIVKKEESESDEETLDLDPDEEKDESKEAGDEAEPDL